MAGYVVQATSPRGVLATCHGKPLYNAMKYSVATLQEACYKRAMTVAERTSGNTSSMLADVLNKKKTEIEYINGTIVREGLKHGISTPANQVLLSLVRASYDLANIRMQHIQDQS